MSYLPPRLADQVAARLAKEKAGIRMPLRWVMTKDALGMLRYQCDDTDWGRAGEHETFLGLPLLIGVPHSECGVELVCACD